MMESQWLLSLGGGMLAGLSALIQIGRAHV